MAVQVTLFEQGDTGALLCDSVVVGFRFKLYLEKLLLTQRMKNMEKALQGIPSIYQPQDKLIDEVVCKMTTNYPQTKFTFYKKTISEANEVYDTMDRIVRFNCVCWEFCVNYTTPYY